MTSKNKKKVKPVNWKKEASYWKKEAIRRFGPIPSNEGTYAKWDTVLVAAYHYAFIEGAKAAQKLADTKSA